MKKSRYTAEQIVRILQESERGDGTIAALVPFETAVDTTIIKNLTMRIECVIKA